MTPLIPSNVKIAETSAFLAYGSVGGRVVAVGGGVGLGW